jgi:hypothetical protein
MSPRLPTWVRIGLAAGFLSGGLVMGGLAVAQQAEDDEDGQEEASMQVRRAADMTPADQVTEAQRLLSNGQSLSLRVQGMLDQSRREGDVLRVTCLDDKLTQVNAHVRTLGDRVEALQEAVRLADEARRNHEYTVIVVLGQNLVVLDRAASECIGQDIYEIGTTRVVTTIDPNSPDIDPSQLSGVIVEGVPFIPAPASASM